MIEFKLEGLDKLNNALKKLPKKVQKRAGNKALRAGARVIQKKAKQLVPVREGVLKRSIVVRTGRAGPEGQTVFVTTDSGKNRKNDGWYSHIVEFGAKHTRKQAFLTPAFETTQKEQLDAIGDVLAKSIIEETAKL